MASSTIADEPRTATASPARAGLAGALAVALALGLTELAAGLLPGVPSAIVSIGGVVIENTPGIVERTAIAVFGTADKLALNLGILVIALGVGALAGRAARRRFVAATAVFGLFAVLGWLAGDVPGAGTALLYALVLGGATAAGLALLARMLDAARDAAGANEGTGHGDDWVDAGRRRFVRLAVTAGATAFVTAAAGRALLQRTTAPARTIVLPAPVEPVSAPPGDAAFEIPGLTPIVVPNEDFYRIDVNLVVPRVDVEGWTLRVHGRVDDEVALTYDDLVAMPLVERYVTIACVSNEVGGGLVGNAAWTGVPLEDLLDRAGVQSGATQIVGRSTDGWTAGFPTEAAFDGRGALVAIGMNGEPLPLAHGFPARLIVPGLYGYVSATKWLSEIELTTWEDFDAYWVPRGWAKEGPIKTQARIDVPRGRVDAGDVAIAGVAWHPNVGISAVEVSVDDGPWQAADLTKPLSDGAWRQWSLVWDAAPGDHTLRVRATDGDGSVQPEQRTPPFPDGATGYHTVRVTAA